MVVGYLNRLSKEVVMERSEPEFKEHLDVLVIWSTFR